MCVSCAHLSANFLKIAFFSKKGAHFGFPNFLCFKFSFGKISFLGLLKHYKIGVSANSCIFLAERAKYRQKNSDNWNFWFGVFVQKWPFVTHISFSKNALLKPLFLLVFARVLFWPSSQKREISDTHQKNSLITEKLFFLVFLVFFLSGEVARSATSLGPKPSLFVFCLFGFFFSFGPPHLALNPPYLFFVCFVFFLFFLSFLCFSLKKKPVFPPKKGHFFV